MFTNILNELQTILITAASAAVTALCVYVFTWLRTYLGIVESDSNENEVRRAAETEAGILIKQDAIMDPMKVAEAAAKIIADLPNATKSEGYEIGDVKDMIIGAAGLVFPPAAILGKLIK